MDQGMQRKCSFKQIALSLTSTILGLCAQFFTRNKKEQKRCSITRYLKVLVLYDVSLRNVNGAPRNETLALRL